MSLEQKIEGVLFYKTEPVKKTFLREFFQVTDSDVDEALNVLSERLVSGATRLVITDTEIQLVSAPELSEIVENLRKDELNKSIGKAGSETLAIVLYRGPLTRADIDRVRGVNSTFIIRNLLIRGLIEKRNNPKNKQSFLYAVTPSLMNHLGITKKEDLDQFSEIMDLLDTFDSEQARQDTIEQNVFEQQ